MTIGETVVEIFGLFLLWRQNEAFRVQTDIIAIGEGLEPIMSTKPRSNSWIIRFWPMLMMIALVISLWGAIYWSHHDHLLQIGLKQDSDDSPLSPYLLGAGIIILLLHSLCSYKTDKKAIVRLLADKRATDGAKTIEGKTTSELLTLVPTPSRLKIIEAHYGVEGINNPDVTPNLLERLRGNSYAELVCADLFHGFDPLPGNPNKKLTVRYSFDGREAGIVRPENEWLILPEDTFLRKLLDACQSEVSRSREDLRESASRNLEYRERLALFNDLQIEAFTLAKQMRKFLQTFEPIPPALDVKNDPDSVRLQKIEARSKWRQKIWAAYELEFAERQKNLILRFGAMGLPVDLTLYRHGRTEVSQCITWEADVITAMAHKIDGVNLSVQ